MNYYYVLERLDTFTNNYVYLNSFVTYTEAKEEMDRLARGFKAQYRIVSRKTSEY